MTAFTRTFTEINLTGRTALVTGSTAGIGFAAANALAKAGAEVLINGRDQQKVDAATREISGNVRGVAADLSSAAGVDALIDAVPEADIVVSNASIFEVIDFFDADDATWDRHWQVPPSSSS